MAYKIALIEDDVMLAEIYQTSMTLAGYECVVAHDGLSGLELIQKELPDLVLLDLMLPQLFGADVLKQMRGSDWGKNIKVVLLTNISESEAPDDIRDYGVEGYIVKANISRKALVAVVEQVLAGTFTEKAGRYY